MLLLCIYGAALVVGGVLLGASLLLGSHDAGGAEVHDLDTHVDAHVDTHVDATGHDGEVAAHADADAGHAPPSIGLSEFWLPFLSVRFWVFFLCFFGLTGMLLTLLGSASQLAALAAAIGMGTVTGFAAAFIFQRLRQSEVGTGVTEEDFRGKEATVLLPLEPGGRGKIRLEVKEQIVDLLACYDGTATLEKGRKVLIIELEGNVALVEPAPELEALTNNVNGGE